MLARIVNEMANLAEEAEAAMTGKPIAGCDGSQAAQADWDASWQVPELAGTVKRGAGVVDQGSLVVARSGGTTTVAGEAVGAMAAVEVQTGTALPKGKTADSVCRSDNLGSLAAAVQGVMIAFVDGVRTVVVAATEPEVWVEALNPLYAL